MLFYTVTCFKGVARKQKENRENNVMNLLPVVSATLVRTVLVTNLTLQLPKLIDKKRNSQLVAHFMNIILPLNEATWRSLEDLWTVLRLPWVAGRTFCLVNCGLCPGISPCHKTWQTSLDGRHWQLILRELRSLVKWWPK